MTCNINWNALDKDQWEKHFAAIPRANLLQSYDYARAVCPLYGQSARWGVIEIKGKPAGLLQMLETGLLNNAIHAVMLDRGPLWFEGFGSAADAEAFFNEFNRLFPRRPGRRRRIIPEIEETAKSRAMFENLDYKQRAGQGYQTIWLDLTKDTEAMRSRLKKNWRGDLRKAEKAGLTIEWDREGHLLPWLLKHYVLDKTQKGYDGPSIKLVEALGKSFAETKKLLIGRALLDNRPVGAILILCHGRAATYQIGWCGEDGRKTAAHNLLLWQAITVLKGENYQALDLGGINDDTAQGVKRFKEGLGGQTVCYAGHYG